MSAAENFEVGEPILNNPYDEPAEHWLLKFGEPARRMPGRRKAGYWYRPPDAGDTDEHVTGVWTELTLVNLIRERIKEWRAQGRPGVTRTTRELIEWWTSEGREHRLFFAQLEAAETIIFLTEARADFLQGIDPPLDEPSDDRKADGFAAFRRYACKMATGSGKTTVMGMLAAWSILNKVNNRSDARFSDDRAGRLPERDDQEPARRTRPAAGRREPLPHARPCARTPDARPDARAGCSSLNWHVFEPQAADDGRRSAQGGQGRAGQYATRETIRIGPKTTTRHGSRYITPATTWRPR